MGCSSPKEASQVKLSSAPTSGQILVVGCAQQQLWSCLRAKQCSGLSSPRQLHFSGSIEVLGCVLVG